MDVENDEIVVEGGGSSAHPGPQGDIAHTRRTTRSKTGTEVTKASGLRAARTTLSGVDGMARGLTAVAEQVSQLQEAVKGQTRTINELGEVIRAQAAENKALRDLVEALSVEVKAQADKAIADRNEQREAARMIGESITELGNSAKKPTYSAVVAGNANTPLQPSVRIRKPAQAAGPRPANEEKQAITIDATRTKEEKSDANKMKKTLKEALKSVEATQETGIRFIRILPRERFDVVFRNETEASTARRHPQWLHTAMPGARMRGETWFPLKCDGVAKQMVMDHSVNDGRTLRQEVLEEFKRDNSTAEIDCTGMKISWLSKAKSEKPVGSLVIWLARKEAVEHLLQNRTVLFGASAAFCSEFEKGELKGPCFNCNTYGHKQSRCTRRAACGICAGPHQTRECNNRDNPKCPACGDAHTIFDRSCPFHPRNTRRSIQQRRDVAMEDAPATTC